MGDGWCVGVCVCVCECVPKRGNPRDGSELGVRQGLQLLFFLDAVILQTPAHSSPGWNILQSASESMLSRPSGSPA